MFSFKALASGALVVGMIVIADNKLMRIFLDIFPNAYNTKKYRAAYRKEQFHI